MGVMRKPHKIENSPYSTPPQCSTVQYSGPHPTMTNVQHDIETIVSSENNSCPSFHCQTPKKHNYILFFILVSSNFPENVIN